MHNCTMHSTGFGMNYATQALPAPQNPTGGATDSSSLLKLHLRVQTAHLGTVWLWCITLIMNCSESRFKTVLGEWWRSAMSWVDTSHSRPITTPTGHPITISPGTNSSQKLFWRGGRYLWVAHWPVQPYRTYIEYSSVDTKLLVRVWDKKARNRGTCS